MKIVNVVLFASLSAAAPQLAAQEWSAAAHRAPSNDIVDTAIAAGNFKTLVAAVQAAGLVDTLRGDGPFTVFAPTDDAFAKLPDGTVASLLLPENRVKLQRILTYHVVTGRVNAKQVVGSSALAALSGDMLAVDTSNGVRVGGANVVKTDITCSNGVIHVIDSVMLPPELPNLVELALTAGSFHTLLAAAEAAGLAEALAGSGPFTVFAPTDAAFAALPQGTVASLLKPENKAKLAAILQLHVVPGRVDARSAIVAGEATSLQGGTLHFAIVDGRMQVNGANVVGSDLRASNGIVHVIDHVILPN
ncbi:MAG: fasciclin domain-containing protein [Planctomycetes bacterium]|nr:fasciclin domain-containing protein [Planctomycetota bacterium]